MKSLLLAPFCQEQLKIAANLDSAQTSEKKRNSRKYFRDTAKDIILSIDRHDANTFPIYLDKITFDIFTGYMNSRKKTIEVQIEDDTGGCLKEIPAYLSISMYDGMRSKLMHLHRSMQKQIDPDLQKDLSTYVKGLKRVVAEEKKKTGQKLTEGKRFMSRMVYKKFCQILMNGESDEYLFAHCFLTLEWNLMARVDNIVDSMVSYIQWNCDSLVFNFAKMKGA